MPPHEGILSQNSTETTRQVDLEEEDGGNGEGGQSLPEAAFAGLVEQGKAV